MNLYTTKFFTGISLDDTWESGCKENIPFELVMVVGDHEQCLGDMLLVV